MGQGRGGFYSYGWLENLFGLDLHNAARLVPEWQRLQRGDTIVFGKGVGIPVAVLVPNRVLVLHTPGADGFTWAFVLEPTGDGWTGS